MASIQRLISRRTGEVSYRAQVRLKGKPPVGKTFPNRGASKEHLCVRVDPALGRYGETHDYFVVHGY